MKTKLTTRTYTKRDEFNAILKQQKDGQPYYTVRIQATKPKPANTADIEAFKAKVGA